MKPFWIKAGIVLYLWYEITGELGLGGGTALAVTLLACAAGMMLPRLPPQVAALPRAVLLTVPAAAWFGLAWWLAPEAVDSFPVFALLFAALLALAGAGARYVAATYPEWFADQKPMLRGLVTPVATILVAMAGGPSGFLALAVTGMLFALPLRLGWRLIDPALARSGAEQARE